MSPVMQVAFIALFVMMESYALRVDYRELGTLENHPHWAPHRPQTAEHYCKHTDTFCNKCDFASAHEIMKSFFENSAKVTIFVVGVNDGSDLVHVMNEKWYQADKAHIYAWEIMEDTYLKAVRTLQGHPEVEINRGAVSSSEGVIVDISGSGGGAGIYKPGPRGYKFANEQVRTLRWDNFVGKKHISEVSYALIDVEGHEMAVIAGMKLAQLRNTFPVFQYELGGTWVDARHEGNMTQADAADYLGKATTETQFYRSAHTQLQALHMATAQRLASLGYRIYLMGQRKGVAMLSPVTPNVFLDAKCVQENGRFFIQGNALAILETAADRMPWLTRTIDNMVTKDTALM